MTYTTVDKVRNSSWFKWNTNITDDDIQSYIDEATGVMLGLLGWTYNVTKLVDSYANFAWSNARKLLESIEKNLASWYLLTDEYWSDQIGETTDGEDKVQKWMDLINWILGVGVERPIALIGNDWLQLPTISVQNTRAYSWRLTGKDIPRKFSVDKTF